MKGIFLSFILLIVFKTAYSQWENLNGPYGGTIMSMGVASDGTWYGGLAKGGLFYSTDEGANWIECGCLLSEKQIQVIFIDNEDQIYIVRDGYEIFSGTLNTGFKKISTLFALNSLSKLSSGELVGSVNSSGKTKIYISDPQGTNWSLKKQFEKVYPNSRIFIDNTDRIYLLTAEGLFRSDDGGVDFNSKDIGVLSDVSIFSFIQGKNNSLYRVAQKEIFTSIDYGDNWNSIKFNLPVDWTNGALAADSQGNLLLYIPSGLLANQVSPYTDGGLFKLEFNNTEWANLSVALYSYLETGYNLFLNKSQDKIILPSISNGIYSFSVIDNKWTQLNNGLKGIDFVDLIESNTELAIMSMNSGLTTFENKSWALEYLDSYEFSALTESRKDFTKAGNYFIAGGFDENLYRIENLSSWEKIEISPFRIYEKYWINNTLYALRREYSGGPEFTSSIVKSADFGETWSNVSFTNLPINYHTTGITFNGAELILAILDHTDNINKIYTLNIDDLSATLIPTPDIEVRSLVSQNTNEIFGIIDNKVVALNQGSFQWDEVLSPGGKLTNLFVQGNNLIVLGNFHEQVNEFSIMLSKDKAQTWSDISIPLKAPKFVGAIHINEKGIVYCAISEEGVFKSIGSINDLTQPSIVATIPQANEKINDLKQLVITLSEPSFQIDNKNISIFTTSNSIPIQTIPIASGKTTDNISYSYPIKDPLPPGSEIMVEVEEGSFKDFAKNSSLKLSRESWILFTENVVTGTEKDTRTDMVLSVYPNPSKDIFNVELQRLESPIEFEINVFNNLGQKVAHETHTLTQGLNRIVFNPNIYALADGIYYLKIRWVGEKGSQEMSKKIIVIR